MSSQPLTSYDLMPYPNYCFPQSHPDRLATIAKLRGLEPQPVEHSRVLELGCAAGSNLLGMAEDLPGSTFLGIDLSQRQIDEGKKAVAELGLTNLELRYQSILDFGPGEGTFDYIICHGVYSWVPAAVQDRILAVCKERLRPNGVAYVSYNTLPGWHMRGMIRDMMLYHGRRFSEPREQVMQARGLLDFLVSSIPMQENPYGQYLRSELERIRQSADSYLFHEHLEEHNFPVYFHQFVEQAAAHGLGYLADVDLHMMVTQNLSTEVGLTLERVSADFIQLEQYMDFLRNRAFRQSLLCHAEKTPPYRLAPESLTGFFYGSSLQPVSAQPDFSPSVREEFRGAQGSFAYSIHPIVKAALCTLGEAWPQVLPFDELFARAMALIPAGATADAAAVRSEKEQLQASLLHFYKIGSNLMELRSRPLPIVTRPGPEPRARPLALWQARSGPAVANLRHEIVTLDEFGRQVLLRLDGRHTRAAVAQELGGEPEVLGRVEQEVEKLARQALLLA